jgi:hypothetical protein
MHRPACYVLNTLRKPTMNRGAQRWFLIFLDLQCRSYWILSIFITENSIRIKIKNCRKSPQWVCAPIHQGGLVIFRSYCTFNIFAIRNSLKKPNFSFYGNWISHNCIYFARLCWNMWSMAHTSIVVIKGKNCEVHKWW